MAKSDALDFYPGTWWDSLHLHWAIMRTLWRVMWRARRNGQDVKITWQVGQDLFDDAQPATEDDTPSPATKIWTCKIGEVDDAQVPPYADGPMREAVRRAYTEITGDQPAFLFSGWGGSLTDAERTVADERTAQAVS